MNTSQNKPAIERIDLLLGGLEITQRMGRAIGWALDQAADGILAEVGLPVLLFFGELGTGKTTLIKAICAGLGIRPETVISPTYTLVNVYPALRPVYHVDLYRIEDPEALAELDRDDWLNPEGPTLIEWPQAALPFLAATATPRLTLTLLDIDPHRRRLTLEADRGYGGVLRAAEGAVHRPA